MDISLDTVLALANKLTIALLLLVIVWAWLTGRVIRGGDVTARLADKDKAMGEKDALLAAMTKDRDEWKTLALSYMSTAKKAVGIHRAKP